MINKTLLQPCYLLLLLLNILFCISCSNDNNQNNNLVSVSKVIDGDTFYIGEGTKKEKIRLIGIDAPESRRTYKKEVGYYGKEAKQYLTKLLKGRKVKLEYDVDHNDQYGRTLAYVYLEDGTFINAKLVKEGYAMVMTVPPNVKYADQFLKYQQEARAHNLGLWNGPYE